MVWLSAVTFSRIESFDQLQVWFKATTKNERKKKERKEKNWMMGDEAAQRILEQFLDKELWPQSVFRKGAWEEKLLEFSFPEMRFTENKNV